MELDRVSPLFVFGCYRSGTSLLRLMLNAHSQIYIPEETEFIPILGRNAQRYGDLGEPNNLKLLLSDIKKYLDRLAHWNESPALSDVRDFIGVNPDYAKVVKAVILASADKAPEKLKYWGDKTPFYINAACYLKELFPDAKFINIIREGRDVLASTKKEKFGWGKTTRLVAEEWSRSVSLAILYEKHFGKQCFLNIRYEDLVGDTDKTMRAICDHLEIDMQDAMLAFYETSSAKKLSRYNHHSNVTSPISSRSVGGYKRILSKKDRQTFESSAGNELIVLGYSDTNAVNLFLERRYLKYAFDNLLRIYRYVAHVIYTKIKSLLK